jgi:hypothetical protein
MSRHHLRAIRGGRSRPNVGDLGGDAVVRPTRATAVSEAYFALFR